MKTPILGAGLVLIMVGSAAATLVNSGTLNTAITDGSAVGITSSLDVSGSGLISAVTVNLNITGGYNGDLYGYLVLQSADNSTTTAILLNRVGRGESGVSSYGYTTAGFGSITLGTTGTDIHTVQTPTSGLTYQADGRSVNPNGDFSSASRDAGLDGFNNINANGTWTLFLADISAGGQSTLVSWGLDISVVPEPTTWALIGFGLLMGSSVTLQHFRTRPQKA